MSRYIYAFAAKELQRYVFRSDKLADMIGASNLIGELTETLLPQTLGTIGIPAEAVLTSGAGGAKVLIDDADKARQFHALWPFIVSRHAPGLQVVQALVERTEDLPKDFEAVNRLLEQARNFRPAVLPETGPLSERAPRTGLPATDRVKRRGANEWADAETSRKHRQAEKQHDQLLQRMTGRDDSAEKATRDFNAMVGEGYLAVIHADGNGLGQMLMTLGNYLQEHPGIAAEVYPLISRIIEETNVGAVRKAFATVVAGKHESGNVLPLRPIVLDGDDLTLAARADLAVDFVAAYLQAFEELSARQLQAAKSTGPLRKIDGLPERLTACAGIAFVKSTYPFSKGYELAEGLCTFAKKSAKALKTEGGYDIASCLAFHRLTCSTSDDYADIQQADLSVAMQPGENLRLWAGPYAVGHYATGAHRKPLAPLTDLKVLSKALRSMPRGSMRGLVQTLTLNPVQAKIDFVRVRQVAKDKGAWAALAAGLKPFVGGEESELWNPAGHTPLLDALALNLMTTGGEDEAADA